MGISANQARLLTLTARQHDLELRAQRISANKMILALNSQQWAKKYSEALNAYSASKQNYGITFDSAFATVSRSYPDKLYLGVGAASQTLTDISAYEKVTTLTESDYVAALNSGKNLFGVRVNTDSRVMTKREQAYAQAMESLYNKAKASAADKHNANWFNWTWVSNGIVDLGNDTYTLSIKNIKDGNQEVQFNGAAKNLNELTDVAKNRILGLDTIESINPVFTKSDIEDEVARLGLVISDDDNEIGQTKEVTTYHLTLINLQYRSADADSAADDLSVIKGEYDSAMTALSSEEKLLDMELTQINTEHNAVKTEYDAVKSLLKDNTEKSFNVFG